MAASLNQYVYRITLFAKLLRYLNPLLYLSYNVHLVVGVFIVVKVDWFRIDLFTTAGVNTDVQRNKDEVSAPNQKSEQTKVTPTDE